jgi:uncharacterized protein
MIYCWDRWLLKSVWALRRAQSVVTALAGGLFATVVMAQSPGGTTTAPTQRPPTPASTLAAPAPAAVNVVATPPSAQSDASPTAPRINALNVVMMLPLDHPLLKRAAIAVRDGIRAAVIKTSVPVTLTECPYGQAGVGVIDAYQRCVTPTTDWVIGPLGRNDVAILATTKLDLRVPTLLLSPVGTMPVAPFAALAPELESEAEAITRQAAEDACRKPILVDAGGPIASRISVAIATLWKSTNAIALAQYEMNSRDRWQRATENWRRDGIDCVLFAGGGATLVELRPYLRGMSTYITSASYEVELERTVDWTGVRIADSTWLLDAEREDMAAITRPENMSPTLARLFALGIDAARLVLLAGRTELPQRFEGAMGSLQFKDGQYQRTPMIGEFRGREPTRLGR